MVDIAGNILVAGRQVPRPSNLLANRAALEGQRIQNSLGEQAIGINKDVNQRAATAATQKERDYAKLQIAQAMNAIAQAQDPLTAARNITSNPQFAQFAQQIGIAPERFEIGPEVTPDIIKQAAINMSTELGGPAYGQLANTDLSSNFRNYLAYSQMPPEQRELYEAANRQRQVIETGAGDAVLGPQGPKVIPGAEAEALATRAANEAGAVSAAQAVGGQGGVDLTPAQRAVDTEFAKEYVEWIARGGVADVRKNLTQLGNIQQRLTAEDADLTGTLFQGLAPDFALAIFNPESLAAREDVEEVVQRNLRLILGAQFTEREGERLIARAYNPRLSEEVNAERVARLLTAIDTAAQMKDSAAKYYEQNGTLAGWQGSLFNINDFYDAIESTGSGTPAPTSENNRVPVDSRGIPLGSRN